MFPLKLMSKGLCYGLKLQYINLLLFSYILACCSIKTTTCCFCHAVSKDSQTNSRYRKNVLCVFRIILRCYNKRFSQKYFCCQKIKSHSLITNNNIFFLSLLIIRQLNLLIIHLNRDTLRNIHYLNMKTNVREEFIE